MENDNQLLYLLDRTCHAAATVGIQLLEAQNSRFSYSREVTRDPEIKTSAGMEIEEGRTETHMIERWLIAS